MRIVAPNTTPLKLLLAKGVASAIEPTHCIVASIGRQIVVAPRFKNMSKVINSQYGYPELAKRALSERMVVPEEIESW